MAVTCEDVAQLDSRARQVGLAIGWTVAFGVAPDPEFVFARRQLKGAMARCTTSSWFPDQWTR